MNEFLEQFLIESRELIGHANHDLLAVEDRPEDRELLDGLFRYFHTLKGGAGIVDFHAMARALHACEDALAAVRAGRRPVTSALVGDLLASLDQTVRWMDAMERSGAIPPNADAEADALVARFGSEATAPGPESASVRAPSLAAAILEEQRQLLADAGPEGLKGRWTAATAVAARVLRQGNRLEDAADLARALPQALDSGSAAALCAILDRTDPAQAVPAAKGGAAAESTPRTFRIDAQRLDALVNLSGELTVAKNAVGHLAKRAQDDANPLASALRDQHAQMEKLVAALQKSVLHMRVQPLRHLFQRFQLLVREMAGALGKSARIVTQGDETEADKAIIEALYEPLLHLIRNAMDHGIESGPQRAAAGKSEVATIRLGARREGEHVVVEVGDDGGGMDVARIRQVALERGVAAAGDLGAMSDTAVLDLIFEPGFSTAAKVTTHSGRGVGMDAVRAALSRLGGRVAVESVPGEGSTVRLSLPFSVMMTQVMTVEAGGQVFGIPLDAVVETVRVPRDRIQPVGAGRALVHRGRTLPVVSLVEMLGDRAARDELPASREATLVSLSVGGQLGAVEIDRPGERVDVMLKPMSGLLKGIPGLSGTTLLGDGSVLMVLDIEALLS